MWFRREGLAEELMAKGADVVLIDGPDLADQIARATGGEPVVLALDAVGGRYLHPTDRTASVTVALSWLTACFQVSLQV
jgi:NADPH:quinone reductase-like Zn-dependent oxidoreductase